MKYLIDSSAWIEYLGGSEKGEKVNKIFGSEGEILVLPINIAEVVSYAKRSKGSVELAYNCIIKNSKVLQITPKIAKEAGILHASLKKKSSGFSLADAFMIAAAQNFTCKLITADNHFRGFKEAILIE